MDKTDELTDLRVQTHVWETIQIRMKEESRYEAEGISTAIERECTRLSTDTWWELQPSPAKICWVQWILWLGESSDSAICADPEENDFPGDRYQLMKLIISRQAHVLDNNKGKGKATMQTRAPSATSSRDSQSTGENPNGNIVPGNENKKSASPSKSNAQFGHITRSFAGINLNQGSTSQSYAGAAREGAKLPDAEDEMAAHWKIVQANAAAEQRRKGGHNFRAFMKRQTAATQKAPRAAEQQQMDRNLLSVDPHPKGQSTYMIALSNSKRYLSAIWGRDKSFFQIKNLIGVDVKFKREQNQLLIYAEADRCHTLLLTNKEQLKLLLVLTHRGLKFWRWLVVEEAKNQPEIELTDLYTGLEKWFTTGDPDVEDYFSNVLKKDDDRFQGLDDGPEQQSSVDPSLETPNEEPKAESSADPTPETTKVEEPKAADKSGQEEQIFLPDGSVFNPNEGDNALKPPYSLVAAGRSKPRERKEYAAESSKAQANSSSAALGPKDTKGKNRENPMFYEALSPDDQMPGDGLPRDKYIPMEDDDFSAFDLVVGKAKKAAKIKAEKIGAKKT